MYVLVPEHIPCPIDTAELLFELGEESLHLMSGILHDHTHEGAASTHTAEMVVLDRNNTKFIVEVDGFFGNRQIAGHNLVSLAPMKREASAAYQSSPIVPAEFHPDVRAIFSSDGNPFKLIETHVRITDPSLDLKRGILGDCFEVYPLKDGTSVNALRTEAMIAADQLCFVGVNNHLVASFPVDRIVGVNKLEPGQSTFYQHFTL